MWARGFGTLEVGANDVASSPAPPSRSDFLSPFEASLGASPIGVTVVRTRGIIYASPGVAEFTNLRACMYVGDNPEFEATKPEDNAFDLAMNRDYFFFEPLAVGPNDTSSSTDVSKRLIDVKSSRKVEELNQTVFFEVSGVIPVAPADPEVITVGFDFSMLLLLP